MSEVKSSKDNLLYDFLFSLFLYSSCFLKSKKKKKKKKSSFKTVFA